MELWIRSQDKTGITKINKNIGLKYNDNKTIIADYIPDFSDNYDGSYDILGTYKTKERALEILNEIQNIINAKTIIKFKEFVPTEHLKRVKDAIDKNSIIELPNYEIKELAGVIVYEMPKE